MKKRKLEWVSHIKEITFEEGVNDFFNEEVWYPGSWEDTEPILNEYLEDFKDVSKEELELLRKEIENKFNKNVSEMRYNEKELLKDRKSILRFIDNFFYFHDPSEGEVGYTLSKEEIVDLIIKNGNK